MNGDGQLDVVAVTDSGDLWALDGKTGATLAPFPIRTGRRRPHGPAGGGPVAGGSGGVG